MRVVHDVRLYIVLTVVISGEDVCCSECVEPTSYLVRPIGTHGGEVMYFRSFALGVSLVS